MGRGEGGDTVRRRIENLGLLALALLFAMTIYYLGYLFLHGHPPPPIY